MKYLLIFLCLFVFNRSIAQKKEPLADLVEYVNPLIGSDSHLGLSNGNTYPTICLPFGMNTWAPHTGKMGNGFLYTYYSNFLYGFKQTHQPSLWINDYGQFSIMAVTQQHQFPEELRKSWFSHKVEVAKPYYYSAYLGDHHVNVEMTPTERAASFRFSFHETDSSYIVIDALDNGSYIKIIPEENKIIGYSTKNNGGVPENFKNYFVLKFDKPFLNNATWRGDKLEAKKTELKDKHVGAVVGFDLGKGEVLRVKVASSFISHEQAELNLREIGDDSFDVVKRKAKDIWNKELNKITVSGGTIDQLRTFYSCLYRMLIFPRKFYEYDKNGNIIHYSPYNGKVLPGYMYTDNGFWDTFRAQFPFFNLMYPSLNSEIMQGLVNAYHESGWLPEWASPGHRDCMIGSHSASIIADAYLKGVRGFDINTLYKAILQNTDSVGPVSSVGRLGAKYYNSLGYIPCDVGINQNASRTVEYAYNDFAIHQLAKALNRPQQEIDLFARRSLNYRNLFDPVTGLIRPRNQDGTFLTPFDPFRWGDHFTEANSWQYTWSVFHDVQGLSNLLGSQQKFIEKLDSVFSLPPIYDISYYKRGVIHLVREMQGVNMGQYAHANEPMHHMVYMYNYGAPWKAQYWVREIMNKLYTPNPDGYCGDEDNGQMSAWYVFSAMGFYPVCPTTDEYVIGTPLFKNVRLKLEKGKEIVINAPNNSVSNRYINSVKVNKNTYTKNWLSHKILTEGAVVNFDMVEKPNKVRGTTTKDFPYLFSDVYAK
ncbi:MAG: GH92 family glycosyl hydrolase [Niabella sp.]